MKNLLIFTLLLITITSCDDNFIALYSEQPKISINLIDDKFTVGQPIFIEIDTKQIGYDGDFDISICLLDGPTIITKINGKDIPVDGTWTKLDSPFVILELLPLTTGNLKLSFAVSTDDGTTKSPLSILNIPIEESAALSFKVNINEVNSASKPIAITLETVKSGYYDNINITYYLEKGAGVLQFGTLTIESGDTFKVPANSTQTLYMKAEVPGTYTLQFTATTTSITDTKHVKAKFIVIE